VEPFDLNDRSIYISNKDKDGSKRLASIPRLIYYLFVEAFEINDTSWRIYYKDGNTLNVTPGNLFLKRGIWSILKNEKSEKTI
jgi:hypothetical protein